MSGLGIERDGSSGSASALDALVGEQVAYYRALAPEYSDHALSDVSGGDELLAALEAFRPDGDVLELACGPGTWTARLLDHASSVSAVDASPEMLAIAAERVAREAGAQANVRFIQGDLFSWRPARRYDVVFFGFWISHVPIERFEDFWEMVGDCLAPDGRVLFIDDAYRTAEELIEGDSSATIERRLNDGSSHRAVKVPHEPRALRGRLWDLGWDVTVTQTSGPFYWGEGSRRARA